MSELVSVSKINQLHQEKIICWHASKMDVERDEFYRLVEENHSFNFRLWLAEDKARREDMGHEFVYRAKREIDGFNQQRNNRMEAIDAWLFNELMPCQDSDCPMNSESPGMMIDRLSILSLKAYYMQLQTERVGVDEAHRRRCADKLKVIRSQLSQLSYCLDVFLREIANRTRTFKIYHQFKMYNDAKLNPQLYSAAEGVVN